MDNSIKDRVVKRSQLGYLSFLIFRTSGGSHMEIKTEKANFLRSKWSSSPEMSVEV